MKKLSRILFVLSLAFLASAPSVFAQEASFTSCLTPTGSVMANYTDGDHGIVGIGSKTGHDTVYSSPLGAMQCFCGLDGGGIQTNWMKASNLSEDQIKIYQNQGWMYVPSGASWGLSYDPYLAQNINYSCNSTVNNGGGSTHGDGLTDGRTDGRTDGKSDGHTSIVQAATGTSLASTGNILFILEIFGVGVFMMILGLIMRNSSK